MKKYFAILLIAALTLMGMVAFGEDATDAALIGDWQTEDGMAVMTIEKNPGGEAWDVEVTSAVTHGAYVFKTTIRYDDEQHCFTYNKGKFWDVPITDGSDDAPLGEAKIAGSIGSFTFTGDPGNLILTWVDDEKSGEVVFHKAGSDSDSAAKGKTIAPQFGGINVTDATCPVSFDRNDIKDGVLKSVHVFTEDIYDIVDISTMAVGDTFEAEGKAVAIQSLETDAAGNININGGMEAVDGYTLTTQEDTNGWTTLIWDDFCTYTERGIYDLPMAENVTLTDSWDIDGETVTAEGIEAVTAAIMASSNDSFYEHNTELVIEGGKVVAINRHYVP